MGASGCVVVSSSNRLRWWRHGPARVHREQRYGGIDHRLAHHWWTDLLGGCRSRPLESARPVPILNCYQPGLSVSHSSGRFGVIPEGHSHMADSSRGKLGIVVGGGPAPGINGVISSVTIEAINQGLEVVGIRDGFKHLVNGDITQVRPLTIPDVAPFYQKGGVMLGTSRTNPAKDPEHMANVLDGAEPARDQVPRHHRRRRHRVQRQPGLRERGRGDQGRPRPEDDRQRPAAARRAFRRSGSRPPGTTACNSPATSTRTRRPPPAGTSSSAWAAPRGTSRWASARRRPPPSRSSRRSSRARR